MPSIDDSRNSTIELLIQREKDEWNDRKGIMTSYILLGRPLPSSSPSHQDPRYRQAPQKCANHSLRHPPVNFTPNNNPRNTPRSSKFLGGDVGLSWMLGSGQLGKAERAAVGGILGAKKLRSWLVRQMTMGRHKPKM